MRKHVLFLLAFVFLVACGTATRTVDKYAQNEDVTDGWNTLEDSAGFERYEKEDTLYYINKEDPCLAEYTMYQGDTLVASHRASCD